jgi:hypothetical protein
MPKAWRHEHAYVKPNRRFLPGCPFPMNSKRITTPGSTNHKHDRYSENKKANPDNESPD